MTISSSATRKTTRTRLTHKLYRGRTGQYLSRLLYMGLLALILWLPVPLGSNRPWALGIIEIAVGLMLVVWLLGFLSGKLLMPRMGWAHGLLLGLWLFWIAWLVIQCIPVSPALLESLAPQSASIYASLQGVEGQAMAVESTISLLPGATLSHLYESIAYAGLFWLVVLLCGVRHRMRGLLWVFVVAGLAQAIYGSLMTLSGVEWGFLQSKDYYRGSATGTFVNRNNFSGYIEITLAAAFGLLIATSSHFYGNGWRARILRVIDTVLSPALLVRVAVVILFAALVLSRSRMGNIAFLAALIICASLYLLLNWRRDWWRVTILMLGFLIIDLWWIGGWFGGDALLERFESTRLETELRAKMLPDLMHMSGLWLLTGAGMGSFHVIYPHFQNAEVTGFNLHAHNDFAQFIIELGLPGTMLLLGIGLVSMLRALMILKNRNESLTLGVAFAALLASGALAIHGIADFNLQIPANAASLVVLLAAVWCCNVHPSRKRSRAKAEQGAP